MSGNRAFDDDRWPEDETGHACCFLCGKKVDPLDPLRGRYSPNAKAFDGLPAHLPCLEAALKEHPMNLQVAALTAINQMSDANMKKALRDAAIST